MHRDLASPPAGTADDVRVASAASDAPFDPVRRVDDGSTPMTDRSFVFASLQGLVDGGLARWSESASKIRTLTLISGEQFQLTERGIVRL